MAQISIKKNFAYKSILTISTYIIGFITFPYTSRVFGVERLGLVNFVDNTISYFLLFSTMGIGILGVREIAASKNEEMRNKTFSNILGLNIWFTIATLIVYFIAITNVHKFNEHSELFYIGAAKIFFTTFLIEWFFTGIENFKYITIRSIIIKLLYVLAVFIFVKDKDDYILYFILTISVVVINACVNLLYASKYVKIIPKELFSLKDIKSNFILGVNGIITSMYLTFNVIYLGLVSNNIQVGYYTTAFKLYSVVLGFFSAFTSVMLPRMSALIADGNDARFNELTNKSLWIVISVSIPIIIYSILMAPQIIFVLSGPGYEGAILPMRIIMPAILFVGIAQVLVVQTLIPLKKEGILLRVYTISGCLGLLINIMIVPKMQSVGSAMVLMCAEAIATILYIIYVIKHHIVKINIKPIIIQIILSLQILIICPLTCKLIQNQFFALVVTSILSLLVYITYYVLYSLHNK